MYIAPTDKIHKEIKNVVKKIKNNENHQSKYKHYN